MHEPPTLDAVGVAWRLGATLLLVLLNGFFVSAEFALVKVQRARIADLAERGSRRAKIVHHMLDHLDRYLSACQLGITLASLALGAIGEPAIASLIVAGLGSAGLHADPTSPPIRWFALIVAFTTITVFHMTLGEQAPKMWALRKSEVTSVRVAFPLRWFTAVFSPFIKLINAISNAMLRMVGLGAGGSHETIPTAQEIEAALTLSAEAGNITERARDIAENVFRVIGMQVRHILVPRGDVVHLSLRESAEENVRRLRESGHSRLPLCEDDLDTVLGVVHVKDVFVRSGPPSNEELRTLARPPLYVPDIKSLPDFSSELQRRRTHVAVVVDEHGSVLGLAFLEDAIEEVVGPIADEFDEPDRRFVELEAGAYEVNGATPLPDAIAHLELDIAEPLGSTIGGHVMATLGRLPRKGDELEIGQFKVRIVGVTRRRVVDWLRFEPLTREDAPAGNDG